MNKKVTDWTKYYTQKRSFFSAYTQKFTLKEIITFFDYSLKSARMDKIDLIELGGGNSCFAENFLKQRPVSTYDIIDNNDLAIELFKKQNLPCVHHQGYKYNLTDVLENQMKQYDFVYSVGLIEHFSNQERQQVIDNHFALCKEDGYVLISFPTPTRKYLFWRAVMERLGLWQFWDEKPIFYESIRNEFEKNGEVVEVKLNKKLFLTQTLVLVQKKVGANV